MSFVTVQPVNIMKDIVLLSLLFIPSTLAACQTSLFISAPQQMEALSGSCLRIPCNFRPAKPEEFDSTRPVFGVWVKKQKNLDEFPQTVVYNSSGAVTIYPMNITGNLKEKNCTTLFSNLSTSYAHLYFFRIENTPFLATAVCDPLKIIIKETPWNPVVNISGEPREKQSVTITCSAITPCPQHPPKLTWNLQQDSHNQIEQNTDGTFTTKIQQTIILSDTHDGNKINCSARYPVNEGKDTKPAETQVTLNVSYAPKETSASISPSASVSAGSWVNLTCSSRAKPPVSSFTWFKKSRDGPVRVSEGDIYSFNATEGGDYYCVATNELGNQTSADIHVTIEGKEKSNRNSLPLPELLGAIFGVILLICLIIFVWWFKSNHQSQQQTRSQTREELVVEESEVKPEGEENIHYGEINFSVRHHKPPSDSVQSSEQQQDTVYAQVKANKPENSSTQGKEELYAEVKKK